MKLEARLDEVDSPLTQLDRLWPACLFAETPGGRLVLGLSAVALGLKARAGRRARRMMDGVEAPLSLISDTNAPSTPSSSIHITSNNNQTTHNTSQRQ